MKMTEKKSKIPWYYIGNNGYEARKVVSGFDLSYNIGTAVTYLLRAERKVWVQGKRKCKTI